MEEVQTGDSRSVKISGIHNAGRTVTILLRGSNKLVLEEADRSLHDALCVIRCLVKKRYVVSFINRYVYIFCFFLFKLYSCRALIAGGGAPEIEIALKLADYAQTVTGVEAYCFRYQRIF